MSGSAPIEVASGPGAVAPSWRVRLAADRDASALAAAVAELLRELGGTPPPASAMTAAARALLGDPSTGTALVAEAPIEDRHAIVGVLGASWQSAIHTPGRYGLIQDLWVQRSWRGSGVGAGLLAALLELARERGVRRVEVGLPRGSFAGLAATEAFYLSNGFTVLGTRMRRSIP